MKIRKNDNVIVIAGKDKGKKAKVLKALPALDKVVVEGVNVRSRRIKARRSGEAGQVVQMPLPIHVSNVQLVDPSTGKGTRVRSEIVKGKKVRIAVKSGKEI
jgi:large subunit ribosomal protein L24